MVNVSLNTAKYAGHAGFREGTTWFEIVLCTREVCMHDA